MLTTITESQKLNSQTIKVSLTEHQFQIETIKREEKTSGRIDGTSTNLIEQEVSYG